MKVLESKKEAGFSINLAYRISSNKHQVSNKRHPLTSAAPVSIHIEISVSPLISAATLNAALIRIVTILY